MEYPTYKINIDFNYPQLSQNRILDLVQKVQSNSPLGQALGRDGNIGEGVVGTFMFEGIRHIFKAKGDKHAGNTHVRQLNSVDELKEQKKIDFVNLHACTSWRLQQMYDELFDTINGGRGDISKMSDFVRAVIRDVHKEEITTLQEMDLNPGEVNPLISAVARNWFVDKVHEGN